MPQRKPFSRYSGKMHGFVSKHGMKHALGDCYCDDWAVEDTFGWVSAENSPECFKLVPVQSSPFFNIFCHSTCWLESFQQRRFIAGVQDKKEDGSTLGSEMQEGFNKKCNV